jgi:predicted methyltransferase
MTKTLLALAALTLTATSCAFAGTPQRSAAPAVNDGTTREVRYVSNAGLRKGETVSKLIITRDASGKIISVKRG